MIFGSAEILASLDIPADTAKAMLVPMGPENSNNFYSTKHLKLFIEDDLIFAGFTEDYYFREKVVFK